MSAEGWTVIGLLVVVLIIGVPTWLTFRRNSGKQRSKAQVNGWGVSVKTEASSDVAPGVNIEDATSREGKIVAEDKTGRGAHGKKLDAKQDIIFTNVPPRGDDLPKR
jgi:hypothetical protein